MRLFVQVKNGSPIAWGLTPDQLRKLPVLKRTSLPRKDAQFNDPSFSLAEFGILDFTTTQGPVVDELTHFVREAPPKLIAGAWVQQWDVVELSEEEKASRTAAKALQMREQEQEQAVTDDAVLKDLRSMSKAEYDTWFAVNITNAAQAIGLLKRIVRLVLRKL